MRFKFFWTVFALLFEFTFSLEANLRVTQPASRRLRAAVYFPALIDSAFAEGLGLDMSEVEGWRRDVGSFVPNHNSAPPISPPKPTTTTEKLPLAQESHVVNSSVTEPPGPSYLTDSVYYHGYPTPAPDLARGNSRQHKGSYSSKDKEQETSGVHLQSLSYSPHYFVERLAFGPLLNPALMHYIPMDSSETIDQIIQNSTERFTTVPSTTSEFPLVSVNVYERPTTPTLTTERINKSPITSAPSSFRRKPSGSRRIRFQPRPSRPQRISRPAQPLSRRRDLNRVHGPSVRVSGTRFTLKPFVNPFETRISKPAVPPVYKRPITKESPLVAAVPEERRKMIEEERTISQEAIFVKGSFEQRKQGPEKTEIYRPPETENSEELFQQDQRNFHSNFSSPSDSAFRRRYRPPSQRRGPPLLKEDEAPVYRTSTKSYRAPSSLHQVRPSQETRVYNPFHRDFVQADSNIYVPQEYNREAIPGQAGVDYPIYSRILDTKFRCSDQAQPGLYADEDARCQMFHICQEGGREDSFLCPNGTVFSQQYFVCDWWYNFSCDQADRFYSLNAFIYELPEDGARAQASYS